MNDLIPNPYIQTWFEIIRLRNCSYRSFVALVGIFVPNVISAELIRISIVIATFFALTSSYQKTVVS